MCLKPHLTDALYDSNHTLYHHAKKSPDWDFVAARQELAAQLQPFIDLFESDTGISVGEYFAAITHLCKWIGKPTTDSTNLTKEIQNHKRSLLSAITEQLFQCYIANKECRCPSHLQKSDCECFFKTNNRVPSRLSDPELIFGRLFYLNNNAESSNLKTNFRLRSARQYLKQSNDKIILVSLYFHLRSRLERTIFSVIKNYGLINQRILPKMQTSSSLNFPKK